MDRIEVTTVEARNSFSEFLNRAAYGQCTVALTRRGKVVAALISPQDLDILAQAKAAPKAIRNHGLAP